MEWPVLGAVLAGPNDRYWGAKLPKSMTFHILASRVLADIQRNPT